MMTAKEWSTISAVTLMIATTIIVTWISLPLTSQIAVAQGNVTQGAEKTVNQTEAAAGNTENGVTGAINATGQFVGNVSETIAENPVVANTTKETQEFFGESAK
jgi:nucleoside permease NupC